ncbi:hypothetical protein Hanom_Chr02g00166421 [Helianthus anomalus]
MPPGAVLRRALLWQGHGPCKFFGRSANFRISREIFYIYYVWSGLTLAFFSARFFRPRHLQRARSATACHMLQIINDQI